MAIDKLKRKNGVVYRVRVVLPDGRRITKCFKRKVDAEAYEAKLEAEKRRGESSVIQRTRFSELADLFLTGHSTTLAVSTQLKYCDVIKNKLMPHFGSMSLDQITEHAIERFKADLHRTEKSAATRYFIFSTLKTLLKKAVALRLLLINPAAGIKSPPKGMSRIEYWTESEVAKFLEAMQYHSRLPLYLIALNTGMREGEIFGLKWDCVDLENGHLIVRRSFCQKEHRIKEDTKTHRTRTIGINDTLRKHLHRLRALAGPAGDAPVLTPEGMGIKRLYHCARTFRADARRAGVRGIRFHDLRHTYATLYLSAGGSISDLASILGHSSVKMTERYGHFRHDKAVKIASVISFDVPEAAKVIPIGSGHKLVTEDQENKNFAANLNG